MKTKKRRYQADPAAMGKVFARIQPFTKDELMRLTMPGRVAFESMKTGKGEEQDFHNLAALTNVCLIRGEAIDPLCVETAKRAQDGLMRCLERQERTGRWGFDGQALQDIPVVLDLYEQMLELSTPQQMHEAMQAVVQRMKDGEVLE